MSELYLLCRPLRSKDLNCKDLNWSDSKELKLKLFLYTHVLQIIECRVGSLIQLDEESPNDVRSSDEWNLN